MTTHLNEEQLTVYFFGDADDADAIREHLAACEACAAEFAAIERTLAAVSAAPVPERDAGYEARVWQRLQPRLDERRGYDWASWFRLPRLAWAGAMAALLLVAFFAGRFTQPPAPELAGNGASAEEIRERILIVAVGDHLEQSKMVLVELVNADPRNVADIAAEQQRAEELVSSNRLYRLTAQRAGDTEVATLLDELERTLLEIAHSPSQVTPAEFESLRARIEKQGILFKVRVVGSELRERERLMARGTPNGTS
jgi:hypothetical protein